MSTKHLLYLLSGFVLFLLLFDAANLYFLSDDFDSLLSVQHAGYIIHSYRPLADASLQVDYFFWRYNAAGYHYTNFFLHFFSTFLLYVFSRQLFITVYNLKEATMYALLTALAFLFYPYHSESLFWIVGRGSSLCTVLALLSMFCYTKKTSHSVYYFLSLLFFIMAALSYEAAWVLPLLVIIISVVLNRRIRSIREWLYIAGYWLVFSAYLILRLIFTNDVIGSPYGSNAVVSYNVFKLLKNGCALVARSLLPPMQSVTVFIVCLIATIIISVIIIIGIRKKINNVIKLSLYSFIICLLPVLALGIDIHTTESERFLYLPSVFFCIASIQVCALVVKKKVIPVVVLLVIAGMLFLFSAYQSFKQGSIITKKTVEAIKNIQGVRGIDCINLPTQYKGAFIFRNGFQSAVQLFGQRQASKINILSESEILNIDNYSTVVYTYFQFFKEFTNNQALKAVNSNHVIFYWSTDTLKVYR